MKNCANQSEKKLSIIIPTYNRIDCLTELFKSLEEQLISSEEHEILIIDNGSNDGTAKLSQTYCTRHNNWKYIYEANLGLANSRNRGWKEASGDYLLYIDDDVILPKNYFNTALELIDKHEPDFFGGPAYPYFNFNKPKWVKDEYFGNNMNVNIGFIKNTFLSGCNLGINKKILSFLKGWEQGVGITGRKHQGIGGDVLIQINAILINPNTSTYFDSELWLYHQVHPEKLKISWSIKRTFYSGKQLYKMKRPLYADLWIYQEDFIIRIKKIFRLIYQVLLIGFLLVGGLFRNRTKYYYWQNYYHEKLKTEIFILGRCIACLADMTTKKP